MLQSGQYNNLGKKYTAPTTLHACKENFRTLCCILSADFANKCNVYGLWITTCESNFQWSKKTLVNKYTELNLTYHEYLIYLNLCKELRKPCLLSAIATITSACFAGLSFANW